MSPWDVFLLWVRCPHQTTANGAEMPSEPLPPPLVGILSEIEISHGRSLAIELALELGGQTISVPSPSYVQKSRLLTRLSAEALEALSELRGGELVDVPLAQEALIHHLRVNQGLSSNQVAKRLGCTRRTVIRSMTHWRNSCDSGDDGRSEGQS